jgi:hypothetical protein
MKTATIAASSAVIREDVQAIAEDLRHTLAPLAGSTLLVTGGSGFLCSYLLETVAYLNDSRLQHPCRLISVDNLRSGVAERVAHLADRRDFRFLSHDVSQPLELDEPVDWIIHGAGPHRCSSQVSAETVDVNVSGTRRMSTWRGGRVRSILMAPRRESTTDPGSIRRAKTTGNVSCTARACYTSQANRRRGIYTACPAGQVMAVQNGPGL